MNSFSFFNQKIMKNEKKENKCKHAHRYLNIQYIGTHTHTITNIKDGKT